MNVIALKKNNKVYLACDSVIFNIQSNAYAKQNCSIFRPKKAPNTVVCCTGIMDDLCRLKSIHDLFEEDETVEPKLRTLTWGKVYDLGFEKVVKNYYEMGSFEEDVNFENIGFEIVATINNELWHLDSYGQISNGDYVATANSQRAKETNKGFLELTSEEDDPIYRICKVYEARLNHAERVQFPVVLYTSEDDKITYLDANELCKIIYDYENKEDLK